MRFLLRPWCWLTGWWGGRLGSGGHVWEIIKDYHWKRGRWSGWIRDSRCTRCGLRPFPLN